MIRKFVAGGIFTIVLFIAGFMFLLRSCLAKYDERSVISQPVLFEKDGKTILFSLVKFDKTTSYEQNGGFIRKSVSTSYDLQTNDAATGIKIQEIPLKDHRDIKSYPIEIIGKANDKAWLFAGELMAFDPFTMEKMADTKIIETKNPFLSGKLVAERKYYRLDPAAGEIFITINDGSKYKMKTSDFSATLVNDDEIKTDDDEKSKAAIESAIKNLQKVNEQLFERFRTNNKAYSQKQISAASYRDSTAVFNQKRSELDKARDTLYTIQRNLQESKRWKDNRKSSIESLNRGNNSFGSIRSNCDTFNKKWYGLYTPEELVKLWERFDFRSSYNDGDRNRLYSATITQKEPGKEYSEWIIGEQKEKLSDDYYLQGGFLLNKKTALPYHLLSPAGFLIVHKDKLGNEGIVLITKVDTTGKQLWTINSGLKELAHWDANDKYLFLMGRDNKELSSGEINLLHAIDLTTGQYATFDFFVNKLRNK